MRFEHVIEINSPALSVQTVVPLFTREQLWRGLMVRVQAPQRFPMGPDTCDCQEVEPGVFHRTIGFGAHQMNDRVLARHFQQLEFVPEPFGDATPILLTIRIEEPHPAQMVLRFVYVSQHALTDEEAFYSDYRHNAWLHNDRDMVQTLRQWLTEEGI